MRLLVVLLAIAVFAGLTGCEGDVSSPGSSAMPEPGTISGTVQLDPGAEGTVEGTAVYIYASREDAMMMRPTVSVVADKNGSFEFASVYSGKYYLGLSKDNDADGVLDSGDFTVDRSVLQNCCCDVNCGSITTINPCIYVIP